MNQSPLKRHAGRRHRPRGFMLIEVLVAVLVFSLGVLTIVGLQAAAVQHSTHAQQRADAMLLVDDLIGRMWLTDRNFATLNAGFSTGGPGYTAWLANVGAKLPGSAAHQPTVTVVEVPSPGGAALSSSLVTVVVNWLPPQAAAGAAPHRLTVVTRIR